MIRFYLGAPPGWLTNPPAGLPDDVGLFVPYGRLARRGRLAPGTRPLPRAAVKGWALDSSGYFMLRNHRRYTYTEQEYVDGIRRIDAEVGGLEWAAQMDWMMEDDALEATGLHPLEHIDRTVENFVRLTDLWWAGEPDRIDWGDGTWSVNPHKVHRPAEFCPIAPTLQGRNLTEYLLCAERFAAAGVVLSNAQVVGVGTLCRQRGPRATEELLRNLAAELDIAIHAFGVESLVDGGLVESADSFAWSDGARRRIRHCGHGLTVWAQNCPACAIKWLEATRPGQARAADPTSLLFDLSDIAADVGM